MKKLTPYLINKKALQFVMAVMLLLGGGMTAWGQATVNWGNGGTSGGAHVYGSTESVIIKIDGTVYIDGPIDIVDPWLGAATPSNFTVTVQPKTDGGTCTIKRASGYTGEIFRVMGTGFSGNYYNAGGHLVIKGGVTFDGENRANCSQFINVYADQYAANNSLYSGNCTILGEATNPVVFQNNTYSAITNYHANATGSEHGIVAAYATFTGNSSVDGAAISSRGTIFINLCTFTNNRATGAGLDHGNGGAIALNHNIDGNVSYIYNSVFSDNTANNDGGVLYFGYVGDNSRVEIENCTFSNNSAAREGGVFQNIGRMLVKNSSFSGNHAPIGGAMMHTAYNHQGLLESTFTDCSFTSNYATNIGGAIKSNWALVLSGCSFDQNHATNEGGAIYNAGVMLVSDNTTGTHSTFTRNYAVNGGAIHSVGVQIKCQDAIFGSATDASLKNYATGKGGAIYLTCQSFFERVGIYNNTAPLGAGVYYDGSFINAGDGGSFEDCIIRYNSTTNGKGGGLYCSWCPNNDPIYGGNYIESKVLIKGSTTIDNNTANYGGGVYIDEDCTVTMQAGSIHNNSTSTAIDGGGVYVEDGTLLLYGGEIYSHTASRNGGGVYVAADGVLYQTSGSIGGTAAKANNANDGGGVYSLGTTILSNGSISYNTVPSNGRGAGVFVAGGTTTQNGLHVIEHNSGSNNGTGVFVNGGSFNMTLEGGYTNHFVRNHSAVNGAGVYVNTNGTFNLSGGYVGQNGAANAATLGGGVYLNGGTFNMTGGNIIYNTASQDGAGVHIASGTMNYEGAGAIEHNTATRNGGGVYVAGTNATLNMKNTKIQLNTAVSGGGVYVNANGTFTMWGTDTSHACELVSNTVTTGNGGGLYHKGTTTVTGLIHINNNTGNRASNNAYLDQSGTVRYLYIGEPGLLCGSDIAIKNNTTGMEIARGTGSNSVAVANAQYAYRNKFFRSDVGLDVYTDNAGGFNTNSKSLYIYTANTSSIFYNLSASTPTDYEAAGGFITKVKTIAGLAYLAYDVNVEGVDYEGHTVTLENDVTLPTGRDWEPIGYRLECGPVPFKGTFDGQFHVIYGLKSDIGYLDAGLFGYTEGATIKNVLIDSNAGCSAAENLGGLIGYMHGGTVNNCEVRSSLTSGSGYVSGGLVGRLDNNGTIHSSCAMPTFTGSTGGGLVGQMTNGSKLHNCFVNTTTASKGLVANNAGEVRNCYARGVTVANLVGGTAAQYCYASSGSASGNNGVFGATALVNGKYGFAHADQQISGGSTTYVTNGAIDNNGELKGLLATLNKWVGSNATYSRWTRTMGADINGDYPVLMFANTKCVGSKDGTFMDYATDLNPMIADYNNATNGGDIYLYAVPSTINVNTASNVRVYINEKVGVLQTTGNRVNARVGVTVDNSSTGFMAYDWHMFSSSLTAANMGLEYHSGVGDSYYVKNNYSSLLANGIPTSVYDSPANMDPTKTTWSTTNAGYFPTNTPYGTWRGTADSNGSFDFYCYGEPYAHWINFKREGVASFYDHWHMDADANGMHQNIPYLNETTMTPGKGYMVALSKPSMLMTDGVLNNGDAAGNVSTAVTATNLPESESGLKGVNLIGNPYQSYLSFDLFAANSINAAVNSTYYILDADRHGYVSYTVGQSDALAPRVLHPHQGFIVRVNSSRNLRFTPSMRATTGDNFREEGPHYALVNLFCADAQDRRDYTTVELDRPEVGGGEKVMGLHAGDASVWIHYDNTDWQTAFTTPGLHEVPVRFKAYKDGFFTMGWETLNGYFSYMHLIDNMTGMDIDCLNAREYHFEGKTTDYTSRFRLVFEFTDVDENDATAEDQSFAFMMGDELVVNGNGMLQVFDLNGRCVYATELYDVQSTVSLPRMTAGVYILRLTGNHSTRTQKMVIR